MILFADASALVAILAREADWSELADRIEPYGTRLCSAMSAWEAMAALCRTYASTPQEARQRLSSLLAGTGFQFVAIGEREYTLAADAYARFGKGRHPAGLNMGDCYAYACARANHAKLLFKGGDFTQTDIAPA